MSLKSLETDWNPGMLHKLSALERSLNKKLITGCSTVGTYSQLLFLGEPGSKGPIPLKYHRRGRKLSHVPIVVNGRYV